MSSSLTRVTGRAPALAAGLLVLAAAMPATAYAAESAPESPLTSASAAHEPGSAGARAENTPKDTPESAESAEANAPGAAAESAAVSSETTEASEATESTATGTSDETASASGETVESAAVAEPAETAAEAEESSGSGYWDSLEAGESEAAAEAEATDAAESGASWEHAERPEHPGPEAPGAPGPETSRPAPPAPPAEAPAPAPSPIEGRTEGGSIILTNGDIVACAAVGDLRVHGTDGREYPADGPGTRFTTTAGTDVVTLAAGHVRVTVAGATAEIQCGAEGFPTVVGLPQTGAGGDLVMMSLAGLGLVAAGGAVVGATRRTRRLRAE